MTNDLQNELAQVRAALNSPRLTLPQAKKLYRRLGELLRELETHERDTDDRPNDD